MEAAMKKIFIILSALLFAVPVCGQTIVTRDSAPNQIVQVNTALNHLTVIQLREPVLSVAAGSDVFKVEWRGNRVFVKPRESGVSTNLFIWTKSGRENYELEPAGPVATMDFAIETPAADPTPAPKPARKVSVDPMKAAAEGMLGGTPVRQESWKAKKHRVQVCVRDLFEQNGELFIRYSIDNRTKKPYAPGTPRVVEMTSGLSRTALAADAYTQLAGAAAEHLKMQSESPLAVTAHDARETTLLPGQETVGVVGVKFQRSTSAVLRLEFCDEHGRTVSAVVVI
jgi:hypothetical protein